MLLELPLASSLLDQKTYGLQMLDAGGLLKDGENSLKQMKLNTNSGELTITFNILRHSTPTTKKSAKKLEEKEELLNISSIIEMIANSTDA